MLNNCVCVDEESGIPVCVLFRCAGVWGPPEFVVETSNLNFVEKE